MYDFSAIRGTENKGLMKRYSNFLRRRHLMKKLIVLTFIGILVLFVVAESQAEDIYVDDDNTVGPWDGTQGNPYQYIQDGVNAASSGDRVIVMPGEYIENVNLGWGISLLGSGSDKTTVTTTIKGSTLINAEGFNTVQDFLLDGGGINTYGIRMGTKGQQMKIIGNVITNFLEGIRIDYLQTEVEIANNQIIYNQVGIISERSFSAYIHNNNISNNSYGIKFVWAGDNNVVVRSNEITFNNSHGIYLVNSIADLGTELDPGLNVIYDNNVNIYVSSTSIDISAMYNWWGQEAVGQEEPTGLPDGVLYDPWLPGPPGGPSIAVYTDQTSYHAGDTVTVHTRNVNKSEKANLVWLILALETKKGFLPIKIKLMTLPAGADGVIDFAFQIPEIGGIPFTTSVTLYGCLIKKEWIDCGKTIVQLINP